MRDKLMGGLLAFGVATPVMIVCCGGGTALLAAAVGGLGAWLSGLGGLSVALLAALAFLVAREFRRSGAKRSSANTPPDRRTAS